MKRIKKPVSILLAFIMVVSLFTIVPVTASAAAASDAHFSQDGDTYTIHDAEGWNVFCDLLDADNGKTYFSGKTVNLGADISVTRMAGGSQHDFTGTFDGQEHTLTVSYGSETEPVSNDGKTAPFRNAESGCVIKNLHTAGTIYTSKKYAGGIIGTQYGTVSIENCRSSVTINSLTAGDGTHGGLVGNNGTGSDLTIDGCVFDGKILSAGETATTSCSGFVGYKHNSVTITNSIYAPAALEEGETEVSTNSATFVRNGAAGTNCYYTRALGSVEDQGKQAYSITAGEKVTLALKGTATVYSVSGITAYADNSGLKYGNTCFAGKDDAVTLTLSYTGTTETGYTAAYTAGAGTLENGVLTMPAENVTVDAGFEQNDYSITIDENIEKATVTASVNTAHYGDTVTLIVKPKNTTDYFVKNVKVNDTYIKPKGIKYSFKMPAEDVTVTAEIVKKSPTMFYYDKNGNRQSTRNYEYLNRVIGSTNTTLTEGWYALTAEALCSGRIRVDGDVHIILNSSKLTAKNGISVTGNNSLTIYKSTNDSKARIIATRSGNDACIGGKKGTVTINGGIINASCEGGGAAIGGSLATVTINGGEVKASSIRGSTSIGASIGGNRATVTINGGEVEATGQDGSAGIGGSLATVTINGGEVKATAVYGGAAIGSGTNEGCSNIAINGGNVTALGNSGAGIGGGRSSTELETSVITLGYTNASDSIYASSYAGTVAIAEGKAFTDNQGHIYTDKTPSDVLAALTGTTLVPCDGIGVSLAGHSLSLDGDIGVNFYMALSDEIAASDTAYMLFTIPNGNNPYTAKVYVNKQADTTLPHAEKNGNYYVFKCNVAAKEINSTIKAQIIDGDSHGTEYTYSVREYADYLLDHVDDNAEYAKAASLVNAMLTYGDYAKEYFAKTDTLDPLGDVTIDEKFAEYKTEQLPDGLFDGATLSLKSQTTLSLYFSDDDELTFTCVDEKGRKRQVETVRDGSTQIARIRNIAAAELQDSFTVTVKKGGAVVGTITYSPMNYCYKAISSETTDNRLKNVAKALYAYSQAANEYFKPNQEGN